MYYVYQWTWQVTTGSISAEQERICSGTRTGWSCSGTLSHGSRSRRRCSSVSLSIRGRPITIASTAFSITHGGIPDALLGDVGCARVMWFSFDGVAFRSR